MEAMPEENRNSGQMWMVLVKVSDDTSPRIMRQMRAEVIPEQYDLPEVDLKFSSGEEFSTRLPI